MSLFARKLSTRSQNSPRRRRHSAVRGAEALETRILLSADMGQADSLAALSDEFTDSASIADWQRVNQTENWNADQLHAWDVNQTQPGRMVLQPHTVVWFEDWRGPLVYKEVTGDFVITTQVHISDRDDIGGSDADDVPGDGQFSLGGVMIRTPRNIVDPALDWAPGSRADDGTNNGENYVFLSMGHATGGSGFSLEVKTTRNSNSQLELTPINSGSVTLQIARIGNSVITMYQFPGENWQVHRRYTRADMPETIQVGLVSYTNWEKASDFDPFLHNSSVLYAGNVADPTPAEPFNPDITAGFEYARFATPDVPVVLAAADLTDPNAVSDGELLSFLGENANLSPTAESGSIAGIVFEDLDGNGVHDVACSMADPHTTSDEPGLPGVTVYVDLNANGQPDGGEPTAQTDANGQYLLGGLAAGSYTVSAVAPTGFQLTAPVAGSIGIDLETGANQSGHNFGMQQLALDIIGDQTLTQGQGSLTLALPATLPDGTAVAYAARVVGSVEYELDQQHDFYAEASYYDNWGGFNERWIHGDGAAWFYLLPTGDLHSWAGSFAGSPLVAQLGAEVYNDPTRLFDVELPAVVSVEGNQLMIDPQAGFIGTFEADLDLYLVNAPGASPAVGELPAHSERFMVTVTNIGPTIDPIADQLMTSTETSLQVGFQATDADGDELTLQAAVVQPLIVQLEQQHDFNTDGQYFDNWGGESERWIHGDGADWFYLLPAGELYEWTGSFAASVLVASLDSAVYDDPTLLTEAQPLDVGVSIVGDEIVIEPASGFVGSFDVVLTAHDGAATATEQFMVTVEPAVEMATLPVLLVIANQDFYYQEYAGTRASLEAAGLDVVVAAATTETAVPHANSGQGSSSGHVQPDLALADASAESYSAIVFVGGWGSSAYQYGFDGTYNFPAYNGSTALKATTNDLINDFVDQDKYVAAICHGVSVLAWARVDGESVLDGRTVSAWAGSAPTADGINRMTRWDIETNGATMVSSGAVGDPTTATDDVIVDGRIITAENYDSAAFFGQAIADVISDAEYTQRINEIFANWEPI